MRRSNPFFACVYGLLRYARNDELFSGCLKLGHALVGRDKGRYAVSASGNWRVTFGWIEADAIDVDLEDYH